MYNEKETNKGSYLIFQDVTSASSVAGSVNERNKTNILFKPII
jgi:hypothetical protein